MSSGSRVAAIDEVPEGGTFLFRVRERDGSEEREAILLGLEEEVVCWLNYCRHFTHIKLDKGSGATMRNGEIVCTNHGAMFEAETGKCTFGPCEGAYLDEIEVTVRNGDVHLVDPDYEYVGVGPLDRGSDLSSTSNLEF